MTDDDDIISGPIFISIGDEEKLSTFLEQNPMISPDQALVDDYSFSVYKAAGFGTFNDTPKEMAKEAMGNMKAPDLGSFQGWWKYLTNVGKVSPIPKDIKLGEIPEGVLRLGGTFVVDGDNILYRWSDRVPGDHPDIEKVLDIAKEAAAASRNKRKGNNNIVQNFFGL